MRIMGRSKGRARRNRYELEKAFSAGAARGFATANMTAQPRAVALGDAINALTSGQSVDSGSLRMVDMLRDPRDEVGFGPSHPLAPAPLDPSRPDTQRPEPRLTEYPVSWNLPGSSDAPVPWATLRAAADAVDIIRRCISVRQEQLQGLDWSITLDEQVVQGMYAASDGSQGRTDIEAELRRKLLPEIERLTAFWRNPWKANGLSFEQWVNGIMEDHLVLDAVAIYPRATYGGELSAFELIDPTTIKLLIDYRGARPQHPYPAFQQILYGFPRAEFGSCYAPETVRDEYGNEVPVPEQGMMADQLFYFREQYRTFTPYGYSAVQQALISARLYLRRQGWMLAEYDDGSTPLTFLVPDAKDGTLVEKLTYKTRRSWEDSINSELAGQTRARNRMKVLMPGMVPHQMQGVDERYKPEYDQHLIKMLAGHFGVTSTGLGFSESKGLGNSGLHEGQERTQDAATTKPDKRMIERIVNELMCTYQDAPAELRFKFTDPDSEDSAAEDTTANQQRARGTITLNEDRKRLGLAPLPFPEADMAMVGSAAVWVPLEGMAAQAEQAREAEQLLVEDQLATSEQTRELTAEQAAMDAEEVSGEDATKALELAAYTRWARKRGGAARRPFICKALTPADWPGEQVPADVDFADWTWVPDGYADDVTTEDLAKAFGQGNDNWRTLARDHRGRWVARASLRVDALGPATPDKPVLAGLAHDASRRRRLAEIKTNQEARRAAEEASRPRTNAEVARRIAGSGIVISARLKGMPAAAKLNPPSNAEGVKVGGIGPDGVVTDDMGRAVGRLHPNVTVEQVEAGGWLRVETGVPGASGGFRTVSVWKEPARNLSSISEKELLGMSRRGEPGARDEVRRRREAGTLAHVAPKVDRTWEEEAQWSKPDALDSQLRVSDESTTIEGMTPDVEAPRGEHRGMPRGTTGEQGPSEGQREARALAAQNAADGIDVAASRARFGRRDANPAIKTPEQRQAEMNEGIRSALSGDAPPPGSMAQRIQARQDQSVRDVVTSLQDAPGAWVAMADVRRKLEREHGMDRGQQDAALRRLATTGDRALNTAPEDNQKTLTDDDHAAAVDFGAGPQHIISLDPPRRSVLDTVRESSEQAAAASAVIDSVPGLREGVARQQPQAFPRAPRNAKPKTEHRVTLPDGTVATRSSQHDYTHAVVTTRDNRAYARHLEAEAQRDAERGFVERAGWREQVAQLNAGPAVTHGAPAFSASLADARTAARKHTTPYQTTRVTSLDAPHGPVTVREEGRQNNPGFALPSTPPAARAEAVAASTPITASVSGTERFSGPRGRTEMKHRVREVSGMTRAQFDALPDDVKTRITADLAHIGAQDDWTEAKRSTRFSGSTGASGVPLEAREAMRRLTAPVAPAVDNSPATIADRVRAAGSASAARGVTFGMSKDQLIGVARELGVQYSNGWKVDKFRDEIAKRHGQGAPKPAPSIESMMAANMASSTAAAPVFGATRGKVTGDQIDVGTRVSFRGTAWEVLEKPRRARPDSEGRTGVVFRARREDQGIEGTMRVNDGSSLELAAPKGGGGGATRPKAEATPATVDGKRGPETIGTRPAAAVGGTLAQRQRVLSEAVTGGVVGERRLGGGQAAETKLVTLADGTKAVHKVTTEAQNDHSPRTQVDAEELAGEVAAALGVRTPAMVRTGPTSAYQEFMPGTPGKAVHGRDIPDSVLASDDGVRLGLLDHITANSDRHGGNWLVGGDGSLTGIDNGMAFDYGATMGTHNPFGKRHFEDDVNPLSAADVARVRERLAALKPRFTAMKRGAWHRAMMDRFDEVARGATGTRDLIP